ncbi:hypothetical protein LJ753_11480 [Arthrobacter sp. zg-Y20]|uniref:hypothetical protein n=1 Tax=unclassified Arthrobacter TaxID=235627 RepID=UPI001D15B096|nr:MULTISPECIES: hypothetical protein [unclassified Arthrobacter]MCC3276488.1 hypothetical protein [Arthrobacter sp. zg-Y20]MDK1316648.1 hypothetical protein [Arthrobacter sp. zg.Y20]WIB06684.1 hypothetical protein QNO06_02780 [Arthrobacter sp. zg-Y20]
MRFTPKNRVRRAAAAGVIALGMLGTAGCSAVNEQATTREYSPSDGIVENVGDLQLRNLLVVSNGNGDPGRLIGTVLNDSSNSQSFTLAVGGSTLTWNLPAGDKVVFEKESPERVMVSAVEVPAGDGIDAQLQMGAEKTGLNIPVVNGDQPFYQQYLPSPTPSESPSEVPSDEATDADTDTNSETGTAPTSPSNG